MSSGKLKPDRGLCGWSGSARDGESCQRDSAGQGGIADERREIAERDLHRSRRGLGNYLERELRASVNAGQREDDAVASYSGASVVLRERRGLGFERSYPTLMRELRQLGLRPECPACRHCRGLTRGEPPRWIVVRSVIESKGEPRDRRRPAWRGHSEPQIEEALRASKISLLHAEVGCTRAAESEPVAARLRRRLISAIGEGRSNQPSAT